MISSADYIVDMGRCRARGGGWCIKANWRDCWHAVRRPQPISRTDASRCRNASSRARRASKSRALPKTISRTSMSKIPLGCLVCVTGVSGSGKSTLVTTSSSGISSATYDSKNGGAFKKITGVELSTRSKSTRPVGRTPRSNPSLHRCLPPIRELFAAARRQSARLRVGRLASTSKGRTLRSAKSDGVRHGDALPAGHLCAVRAV